ncbi:Hypothetical predicted protein [Octopus vulgaris]|uniref:Uncharacterized protein n=1 Tax=Octopus vulgaris TaxID=6645 RepID=A0AA36F689_OCTVU|nr:Hypothetical predicted protein [Octopus vulgaris]
MDMHMLRLVKYNYVESETTLRINTAVPLDVPITLPYLKIFFMGKKFIISVHVLRGGRTVTVNADIPGHDSGGFVAADVAAVSGRNVGVCAAIVTVSVVVSAA